MVNSTQPEQIQERQRQAWLTEYQACQQHNDSIGSQVWVSTTIFLTINVTLLGGLFYTLITRIVLENPELGSISLPIRVMTLIGLTALSSGIIWILGKWVNWLKRMRFRTSINFERMGEIEPFLGMRKHTMCRELDQEYDLLKTSDSAEIKEFQKRNKHFKYFRAGGFDGLIYIAKILMGIWVFTTLVSWTVIIILPVFLSYS